MGSDKIWKDLMELSIRCGMNQRYDQFMLTNSAWWSKRIDVVVVVATMISLMFGVAAYFSSKGKFPVLGFPSLKAWHPVWHVWRVPFDKLAVFTAVVAAVAGIVLIISPAGEEAYYYNTMFQAWSDLRQDVDSAIADADAEKPLLGESEQAYLERRYRDLLAKKNALNAREPAPDGKLLDKFLKLEQRSRGVKDDDDDEQQANRNRPAKVAAAK